MSKRDREVILAAVIAEHIAGIHCDTGATVKESVVWATCESIEQHPLCGMCPEHNRPRYACRCVRKPE